MNSYANCFVLAYKISWDGREAEGWRFEGITKISAEFSLIKTLLANFSREEVLQADQNSSGVGMLGGRLLRQRLFGR